MAKMGIYSIKNKLNNKYYIGQSVDIQKRWRSHRLDLNNDRHYNKHLQRAWNKYGKDAFEFSVIKIINDSDLLDTYEEEYIASCKSYENGYNQNKGGLGTRGKIYTEEEKMKSCRVKPVMQLDKYGNIIDRYYSAAYAGEITGINKETIRKVSQRNSKGYSAGGYVWMYEEDYEKYGFDYDFYEDYIIVKCFKEVAMIDLSEKSVTIFDSYQDASEKTGINQRLIESLCDESRTSHKTSKGVTFCFKEYLDEIGLEELLKKRKKKTLGRPVVQIDKETLKPINVFESACMAGRELGINGAHISGCIRGERKTCGGFKWELYRDGRGDLGGKTVKNVQD